uniref:Core Histone H2A/H2B/H3 domain-containing protein n=1 Tax=Anopheles epiroticus TaxID=199890 RepID=A0A182PXI1_9DIPT
MAPRKKDNKQPKPRARQITPEPTHHPPRQPNSDEQFRSLKPIDDLRNVMGEESDNSAATGSEMESYRDNTSNSRPNFSFLPSHKHSSPNHNDKRANAPSTNVHRLASMSTVPNSGLDHEDTESPRPTTSARRPSRNERRETSSFNATNTNRTTTTPASKSAQPHGRKQKTPSKLKVLKEIIDLQGTVHNIIPKLSFGRVIREVLSEYSDRPLRVTVQMLECLQESAEIFLVQLFEDSYRCTLHRNRATLIPKDMQLAYMLRGN